MKEKNGETCSKHPEAKDGVRFDRKILSPDGWLQNAVVFIENIEHGKTWGKVTVERKLENQALPCFIFKTAVYPLPFLSSGKPAKEKKLAT